MKRYGSMNPAEALGAIAAMTPDERRRGVLADCEGSPVGDALLAMDENERNDTLDEMASGVISQLELEAGIIAEGFSEEDARMWRMWTDLPQFYATERIGRASAFTGMEDYREAYAPLVKAGLLRFGEDGWHKLTPSPGLVTPVAYFITQSHRTKPRGTMNALQLSDPDRRRALVGVVIHLDETGDAGAAVCRLDMNYGGYPSRIQ